MESTSEESRVDNLVLVIQNDKAFHDSVFSAIKILRSAVDRAAVHTAKERAAWHDDPSAEDHADFHAPASIQFPRKLRDKVARELFDYWLNELAIQEGGEV